MKQLLLLVALSLGGIETASAQERVHADLPLFTGKYDELWPKHFTSDDSFGCSTRVALGDWKFAEAGESGEEADTQWVRLSNYGAFHCAIVERWASEREELDEGGYKHSWFVELGRTKGHAGSVELWALQSGARPGSDYLLLSRKPGDGLIKSFEVLQLDCPQGSLREGDGPDIWRADYCAIDTVQELKTLARRMARKIPAGTLSYVGELSDKKN